jgi:CPA2 family monovalent cation:H+ antiporter-2
MHLPLLQDLLILIGFSTLIVFVLKRAKLPAILGFLITGILIGPYSLSLIKDIHEVEILAEIGVILLLFVIGMELSLKQLISIKRTVFIGGTIQVFVTVGVTALVYSFFSTSWGEAVFMGFIASLSSTAIVLSMFQDSNEMSTPQGKNALGILIFQDLIVVPMMLVTPIISGQTDNVVQSVLFLLLKSAGVILITILSAKYIVPHLLHEIAKTRSKELFLLTTLTICFAVAFLTSEAGLSLALGAFLAGLIVSESEYSHQATSFVLPFRSLFTSFFFISVGMMLDVYFLLSNFLMIVAITAGVFLVKGTIATLSVLVLKYPVRTALLTGLALFQVGEFAFILSKVGVEYGLLTATMNQYFLAVSIISMLLTPLVFLFSGRVVSQFMKTKVGNALDASLSQPLPTNELNTDVLKDHLIIIGYGLNGSHLAKAAEANLIPYVVIDVDAEIVRRERQNGVPILFGNAADSHLLDTVNLRRSRAVVIALSDYKVTEEIVRAIRMICQTTYLVVRSQYLKDTDELIALGADHVIPAEFETSIEISSRILNRFLIPVEDIDHFIAMLRSDHYHLLEGKRKLPETYRSQAIPNLNITTIHVGRDSGGPVGKTIREANVRNDYGVNIIGICRNDQVQFHFDANEKILQDDLLFVYGESEQVHQFQEHVR